MSVYIPLNTAAMVALSCSDICPTEDSQWFTQLAKITTRYPTFSDLDPALDPELRARHKLKIELESINLYEGGVDLLEDLDYPTRVLILRMCSFELLKYRNFKPFAQSVLDRTAKMKGGNTFDARQGKIKLYSYIKRNI